MTHRPTNKFKWFRAEHIIGGTKPLAVIAGYPEDGHEYFCLKQLWVSDLVDRTTKEEIPDEWRDIEVNDQ